jgi:copper transport protein
MMRRSAAIALAALVAGWLLGALASPAFAHALLQSSQPAANATLRSAPSRLSLTFTEPPDPSLSSVQLLGSSGQAVALGRPVVNAKTIVVPITGSMLEGTFTVNWRVVSKTDGHVTAGSFAFGVGQAPTHPSGGGASGAGSSPFPSALSIVAKWLLYAGLSVALAAAVVAIGVLRRRPAGWPLIGAGVATLAGWAGLVASEASAIGVGASTFLRSAAGRPDVWLGASSVVVLALSIAAVVARRAAWWWATSAVAAIAMLIRSIGGHADAGRFPALEIAAQFAHFAAVGVWIGGLVWLIVSLPSFEPVERSTFVARYSNTAAIGLAVVAVTGVVRAVDELGGITHLGRLFSTDYGWTLVAKSATSIVLIAAGTWNHYVNVPRAANGGGRASLGRVVTGELVLATGLFGLTGLLTGLPPATGPAPAHANAAAKDVVVTGSDFATTVRTRLTVTPGTVGSNAFDLRVVDYDTGRPIDATQVTLEFAAVSDANLAPSTMRLMRSRPGEWTGTGSAISIDDRWRAIATIQTATGSTQVTMELSPRVPAGRTVVSRAPGEPALYTTTFDDGSSIQAYVDPGTTGPNQLHATAFDPQGNELPLRSVSLIAIPPSGPSVALQPIPFSPGHDAANVPLTAGTWSFEIRAVARSGQALDTRFTERIAQGNGGTG